MLYVRNKRKREREGGSTRVLFINQFLRVALIHDASCAHEVRATLKSWEWAWGRGYHKVGVATYNVM